MKKGRTESDVRCDLCDSTINIANAGKSEIDKQLESTKHKEALSAISNSRTVTNFFTLTFDTNLAACEGVWSYHVVKANNSFISSDCASKIFRTCFEMRKFYCARTKCEAIVTNVFAPFVLDEVKTEMACANYITISTDASNRGNVKMLPVLARYFFPTIGVRVKMLEYSSVVAETSVLIANLLTKTTEDFQIKEKIVGFCADNCPTNFGSRERGGYNNVYYRLKELKPSLIGVGCAAHIVHSALKSACDALPIDVECVVVKFFSHFYIYTVRVEELKSICVDMDVQYSQLLGYAKTRFLAMGPAVGRILSLFDALKRYFLAQSGESFLKKFFDEPFSKLWLLFVKEQVNYSVIQPIA